MCLCVRDDEGIELNEEVPEGRVLLLYSRFTHQVMEANIGEGGFYDQFEGDEQNDVMDSTKTSVASVDVLLTAYADLELHPEGFLATLLERYSSRSDRPAMEDAKDVDVAKLTPNTTGRDEANSTATAQPSASDVDAQRRIHQLTQELDVANATIRRQKQRVTDVEQACQRQAEELVQRLAQIDRLKEDAADNNKAQRLWDHDRELLIKKLEAEVVALKEQAARAHPEVAGRYAATLYETPAWMG